MDLIHFIFLEVMKTLGLAFLGLVGAKAIGGLAPRATGPARRGGRWIKGALYALTLALVGLGAYTIGNDIAAEIYIGASRGNLGRNEVGKAYTNASRAVQLRPGVLGYWQTLSDAKLLLRQFGSLLADASALGSLNGGKLDEKDAYRSAVAYYFLGEYDKTIPITQTLIQENRLYAPPYILQGHAYTAQRKYAEAQQSYLDVLQAFPANEAAVKGLAHARFLAGSRIDALSTIDETAKFPFPPAARQRLAALRAFYAQ